MTWRRGIVGLVFCALIGLALSGAAAIFERISARTELYRYLSDALGPVSEPADAVTWLPPERALVREVTPGDEALVGRALTQAWRAFTAATSTGQTNLLADHFAGVALDRATEAAASGHANGTMMVVLRQLARPRFVHLDGSLTQIEASALTVRFGVRGEELSHYELTEDRVRTTLTNETTGWRITAHERSGFATLSDGTLRVFDQARRVGLNYYPAATPWRKFWPDFDRATIERDFALMSGLGANTVRIFLPTADFGPDAAGRRNLDRLAELLSVAEGSDIDVIVTLFDLKAGYLPALWSDDAAYLTRVLPVLAAAPAVVLIDLKNEPDLDQRNGQGALVTAWLRTMLALVRIGAPSVPVTIGWSTADRAGDMASELDVISYHDYAPIGGADARLAEVRSQAQGKPVIVSEIGESSYGLLAGFPGSDAGQARAIAARISALAGADGVLVWTLHDFGEADAANVGAGLWARRLQARFGLFGPGGAAKPAAAAVRDGFAALTAADPG